MMSRGLRDQENTRINNILKQLIAQKDDHKALDALLKDLVLKVEVLEKFSANQMIDHLEKLHFDAENMELFADFLASQNSGFKLKAKAVYQHIQSESAVFSLAIQNKLLALK